MKKYGNLVEQEVQSYRYLTISQCKFLFTDAAPLTNVNLEDQFFYSI